MAGMGEARGRVPDSGCPGPGKGETRGLGDLEIGSEEESEIGGQED